jgi:DNA processing protein
MSYGPNLLIRQGAHLVLQSSDILDDLPADAQRRLSLLARNGSEPPRQAELPYAQEAPAAMKLLAKQIVKLLKPDAPTSLDALLDQIQGASASETIAALFDLELMGLVRQLPGKCYLLVW